jgi:3-hydroxybutyryl-CoA dehydratase
MTNMDVKIGDVFSTQRQVTDELIRGFAEVSGDFNPIHLDDGFAKTTPFGRRIAHGMLSGALISGIFGNVSGDHKIVYLAQTLRFVAPVFINDTITVTGTVSAIRPEKGIVTLDTICSNQDGEITVKGEATVMVLS